MKIAPELIGFDIDGVVADTAEAFIRLAAKDHGIKGIRLQDITEFDVAQCLPIGRETAEAIFEVLLTAPLDADLRPMPNAVAVLTALAARAPLTFITARPREEPIAAWLCQLLGPRIFNNCRLIAMGNHDGKYSYIKELGLRYFVDDRAQTCIDLHQEGLTPLVYEQPWNQGRHQLRTVDSWLTISRYCA